MRSLLGALYVICLVLVMSTAIRAAEDQTVEAVVDAFLSQA